MVSVVSTAKEALHGVVPLSSILLVGPTLKNFETFFYNPSVAVQMENESFENVVILQYENDKRTKSSESVIPSVERDLATCPG